MAESDCAALRCADLAEAVSRACTLVADPSALTQARKAALTWSQTHQGATQRTLDALGSLYA